MSDKPADDKRYTYPEVLKTFIPGSNPLFKRNLHCSHCHQTTEVTMEEGQLLASCKRCGKLLVVTRWEMEE